MPSPRFARIFSLLAGSFLAACLAPTAGAADSPDQLEFFEKKVRPVLAANCYECHSAVAAKAGKLKGKLQLDTRDGIRKGGETGPAVVPGDVKKSLLVEAVRHQSIEMPPKGKLPEETIADLVKWIETGAADPRDGAAVSLAIDVEQGRKFWAFVQPQIAPRPKIQDDSWPLRESDWFVRAAQEEKGLQPVRPATKEEWLRRVSFDLIGLPPSLEEIEAFLKDDSPQAFDRVVDRLLASPHYGERWGRA